MEQQLSTREFLRIYSDKKFRNCVVNALTVRTGRTTSYKVANDYPRKWKVTQEQIDLAKEELERSKLRTLEEHEGELILVGMGSVRECEEGGISNHRARGYFLTPDGRRAFIEISKGIPDLLEFDFAFYGKGEPKDRVKCLEGMWPLTHPYTQSSVLELVNANFGTKFTAMYVDNYDLMPDETCPEAEHIEWLDSHIFVSDCCGVPTKVYSNLEDAKEHDPNYIAEFDKTGSPVAFWVIKMDGSYTNVM